MEFMPHLRDWFSVIPDEAIAYFIRKAGIDSAVPDVLRICGLAGQKFISDVSISALHYSQLRARAGTGESDGKITFTMDDLQRALHEYDDALGIPKNADYFV